MKLPSGAYFFGFGLLPWGFYNGKKRAPIRGSGWHVGWLGIWKYERYFRHIGLGIYIRWPANSKTIEQALKDEIWG